MKKRRKLLLNRFSKMCLKLLIFVIVITGLWVAFYRFVNPPFTPLMAIRFFEETSGKSLNKEWKDYEYISENLALAIIAAEDQNFLKHNGFDIEAIQDSVFNKNKEKRFRGASTISQQVAKNLFLWPERSWLRKGIEAYFTFLIETIWSKKRILEIYLNIAEMGNGVYGAEAASKEYFKKPASLLSKGESAYIAALLPNPRYLSSPKKANYVHKKQKWILRQMNNLGGTGFLKTLK